MLFVYAFILTLLNAFWLALNLVGLPGNWLIVLGTALFAYLLREQAAIHPATLISILGLAVLGEVLEFALGAAGAAKSGGSRRGALGAIVGAIVGGVIGTVAIPIPLIGSILGACGGAFVGAMSLELSGGRRVGHAVQIGRGAAVGRFWGTVAKLGVGAVMWVIAAIAAFWP